MAKNGVYAVFFVPLPATFPCQSGRDMLLRHFQQQGIRDRSGSMPFWTGRPERTDDNGRETERAKETPLPMAKSIPGRIDQERTPSNVQTPHNGTNQERTPSNVQTPHNGTNQDRHQVTYRAPHNGTNQDRHQVTYRHKKEPFLAPLPVLEQHRTRTTAAP